MMNEYEANFELVEHYNNADMHVGSTFHKPAPKRSKAKKSIVLTVLTFLLALGSAGVLIELERLGK